MNIEIAFEIHARVRVIGTQICGVVTAVHVNGTMTPQYRVEYLDKESKFINEYFVARRLELAPTA